MKCSRLALLVAITALALQVSSTEAQTKSKRQPAQEKVEPTPAPEAVVAIAKETLSAEKNADPKATIRGSVLHITYSLAPWALTTGTTLSSFNVHVSKMVPAIFAKFPNYNEVLIVGRGKFTNIRGNSSEGDVASALFTRKNAETIKWDNISLSNIPKLADAYGVHPSLRK